MNIHFSYLKKYVPGGNEIDDNWFFSIDQKDTKEAEASLKNNFPTMLRSFYSYIGYGMLRSPHIRPQNYRFYGSNEILPPLVAAHFYQGILEHQIEPKEEALEYKDHWLALETLEMLEPGDLPFFEIGDSSSFMTMKLHSNNPNAVWYMGAEKIEDSFERFIWRLYYEDPSYYTKNW